MSTSSDTAGPAVPTTLDLGRADIARVRARAHATGGCLKPVHLAGHRTITDRATGRVLDRHAGTVYAPCGNRRESVCPACSDRYAADAYHLIKTGMAGGKTISETVADKPRLFLTVTAPSFGPIHNRRTNTNGRPTPCGCGEYHHPADTRLGTPIDPDTYDYTGAVLWQAHASELWHRLTIRIRRELARTAGIRVKDLAQHLRLSYAKVAEYQRRGLIHFHAVIRLDGPNGATDPAPAWANTTIIRDLVRTAVDHVELNQQLTINNESRGYRFTFGKQVDIRPIQPAHARQLETADGHITDHALAGYIAKYATKGTATSEVADRPVRSKRDIDYLTIHPHHKHMMRTAWTLGANPELDHLRRWTHMLGFRGHFLTKSQRYSLTFKTIRGQRRAWQQQRHLDNLHIDSGSVLVINDWHHTGTGYNTPDERELAAAIYQRKREHRKQQHRKEHQQ